MTDLVEHDPHLITNPRQAHRHLQLVTPYSGDAYDQPQASERMDSQPLSHPPFTFLAR